MSKLKIIIGIILILFSMLISSSAIVQIYTTLPGYGKIWLNLMNVLPVGNMTVTSVEIGTYVVSAILVFVGILLICIRSRVTDKVRGY